MLRIEEIVGAMDDEFRYALDSLDDGRLAELAADKAALRRLRPVGVSHAEAMAMIAAIQERRAAAAAPKAKAKAGPKTRAKPRPRRKPAIRQQAPEAPPPTEPVPPILPPEPPCLEVEVEPPPPRPAAELAPAPEIATATTALPAPPAARRGWTIPLAVLLVLAAIALLIG